MLNGSFKGIGLAPEDSKFAFRFKVFATTEELDYQRLLRPPLEDGRPLERASSQPEKIPNDWAAFTFVVTLDKT